MQIFQSNAKASTSYGYKISLKSIQVVCSNQEADTDCVSTL